MANVIKLKRSATGSDAPTAGQLEYGELAINYADGKLYYKNTSDEIGEISGSGENNVQSDWNQSSNSEDDFIKNKPTIAYTSAISEGNSGLVPSAGSSGQFLQYNGQWATPSYTTNTDTQLTTEQVQDIVGGMLGGTETRISVSYDDTNGRIDFVVDDMNDDTPAGYNNSNWDTAYGWGNHASGGYAPTANPIFTGSMRTSTSTNYAEFSGVTGGLKVKSSRSSDAGILLTEGSDAFRMQLYANAGTEYGFLDSAWGAWDLRKTYGGELEVDISGTRYEVIHEGRADWKNGEWNTAYSDRLKWNGDSTGLTASTGRSSLGLGSLAVLSTNASTSNFLRGDGSWVTPPDTDTNTQLSTEQVQDIVGGMLGGTETRISVSYDDTNGRIDFVVDDLDTDTNTWRGVTAGGNTLSSSETLAFTAGSNVTISESGGAVTIASTDTNTTYSNSDWTVTSLSGFGSSTSTYLRNDGTFATPPDTDTNTTYSNSDWTITSLSGFNSSTSNFLRGDGSWVTPPDTNTTYSNSSWTITSLSGFNSSTSNFLRGDGTWVTPPDTDTNTTYSVGDGGLTQNNFTDADHSKLDGIPAGADVTSANTCNSPNDTNASTLDGIDSTYFTRGANQYGLMSGASGGNMNSIFTSTPRAGFFDTWSGDNFPSGTSHIHGIQVRHNSGSHYGWQLAGQYNQNAKLHVRMVSDNTWSSWYELWSSGNDGSGSGLDADLLDGQQGSYYYQASNPNSYITASNNCASPNVNQTISINDHTITLSNSGGSVTVPDNNTTYSNSSWTITSLSGYNGSTSNYLRGDGNWVTPPDTDTNTTYSNSSWTITSLGGFNGSTSNYLRGDGNWVTPPDTDTNTTYSNSSWTVTSLSGFTGNTSKYLRADGSFQTPPDNNTTYSNSSWTITSLSGFNSSTSNYLRGDGNWVTPPDTDTNTTYSNSSWTITSLSGFNGSSSNYLRGDGNWVTPPDNNTTYGVGDGGLTQVNFTSTRRDKLDGIASSANNYSPSCPNSQSPSFTGHIYLSTGSKTFQPSYNGTASHQGNFGWRTLQLGNNGTNYILAGNTVGGGSLMIKTSNTANATDSGSGNGNEHFFDSSGGYDLGRSLGQGNLSSDTNAGRIRSSRDNIGHSGIRSGVVIHGEYDQLQIQGRVIDWTNNNLHFGYGNVAPSDKKVYFNNYDVLIEEDLQVDGNLIGGDIIMRNDRGDFTLFEEEEYICVRNNNSGQLYKLVMEEIEG